MNIIEAIKDKNLFLPYLQGNNQSLKSWQNWLILLRVIYGLPVRKPENLELIRNCTHRDPAKLPKDGFDTVLILVGRRGGKSKISGLIGAFESLFSGREKLLSPGEIPCVTITSPTKDQSTIIKSYTRAALGVSPMLDNEVDGDDTKQGFKLQNGVHVRILTGDFRSVRGFTQLAVIVDELCYFGYTEESKIKSDVELIRSIRPALLTTKGKLIGISTKYSPKGWCYGQWKKNFGNDSAKTLIWDAASRVMNPLISEQDVQDAIDDDPTAAKAEFLNEWRDDIQSYLPIEVVESCVVKGRIELLPRTGVRYFGFCDMSGGRFDSAGLCIGHRDGQKVVLDFLKEYRAPFNPNDVTRLMSGELKRYGLNRVVGDKYSAEFCVQSFRSNGIIYINTDKVKSELYLELLPLICSKGIELLDNEVLVKQLSSLERRTRSGGKDTIDHAQGAKDDIANSCAGAAVLAAKPVIKVGGWNPGNSAKGLFNSMTISRQVLAKVIAGQQAERNSF